MRNAGLEKAQAGIKVARRNINNLRYADDTTLMAESEEELKSPLMKVNKESEKVGLKLNIQKTKIIASGPITSWQIDGETVADILQVIIYNMGNCFIICIGTGGSLPPTNLKILACLRQCKIFSFYCRMFLLVFITCILLHLVRVTFITFNYNRKTPGCMS